MEGASIFEEYLLNQKKITNYTLKKLREQKRKLQDDVLEPHEDGDDDDEEKHENKTTPQKKKKPKKTIQGPCSGRVWLGGDNCPGADANRGRNPEKDANTFVNTFFTDSTGKKNKKVLCVSCKREYGKWKKEQPKKE